MSKTTAIFISIGLTVMVIAASFVLLNVSNGSFTQKDSASTEPALSQTALEPAKSIQTVNQTIADVQSNAMQREENYRQQISTLKQTLADTETANIAQLEQAVTRLSEANSTLTPLEANVKSARTRVTNLQQAIQAEDVRHQAQLEQISAQSLTLENDLQTQLNTLNSQLQLAYDEIATRQALIAAAQTPSNTSGNDSGNADDHNEDHGDDQNDDHDDDHHNDDDDDDDHEGEDENDD